MEDDSTSKLIDDWTKFQFMCKPSAEGKLVFTMPRRSHKSGMQIPIYMRTNNSKTDFWVFIFLLSLCVIAFVLSIKEAIEDQPDWVDICAYSLLTIYFITCIIRAKNKKKNK